MITKQARRFLATIASLIIFCGANVANAGILVEPYLGYTKGKWEMGSTSQDFSGVYYGGRLGYSMLGLMGGLDFQTGKLKDNSSPTNIDLTPSDLGIFVGYNLPVMLRVYGSYFFSSKLKSEAAGTSNTYEGKNMRLGVGFTSLPFVSINLEYGLGTYTKDSSGSLSSDMKTKWFGLNVSVPFDF